jgi:CysZ protein
MVPALLLALSEIFDPRLRRVLALSLVLTIAVLVALIGGIVLLLDHTSFFETALLNRAVAALGDVAALALSWLLFPAVSTFILGFFLEGAIATVEARRYPGLPPPRRQGWVELLRSALRLTVLAVALNLLALPLYLFLPGLNLVLFYAINGWLLGREYFELVALRRLDERARRAFWQAEWLRLIAGGVLIAFLLSVPVVNLAAPLIAALFMLHLFEALRQRNGRPLAAC